VNLADPRLPDFLATQIHQAGGNVELDPGLWLLFVVAARDEDTNALARELLAEVSFAHDSGMSHDDQWMLYYIDTANRAAAIHWLEDARKLVTGEIRPVGPEHRALIRELVSSTMPHRVAQRLVVLHLRDQLGAGSVVDPATVRALIDRLHQREALFFSAFQLLLSNHLIDMVVLLQKLIAEDVELLNEIMRGGRSSDPILRTRQDAAAAIRHLLTRFHVINPLDQHKNSEVSNPYAAFLEIVRDGDRITTSIDGTVTTVLRDKFLHAIRTTRRQLYLGQQFDAFDTQVPWMTDDIAYPFRFIKQRLGTRRDLAPLDGLYMLERAL